MLPVLDNTKGDVKSKYRSKSARWHLIRKYMCLTMQQSYRYLAAFGTLKNLCFIRHCEEPSDAAISVLAMTKKGFSLVFSPSSLILTTPVQARREAQGEPEGLGCDCLSAASFTSRRTIRASQGIRRAGMLGILSFGDFSLDKQRKATRP